MGKIIMNGKTISHPFEYNGKRVVAISKGDKVVTLHNVKYSLSTNGELVREDGTSLGEAMLILTTSSGTNQHYRQRVNGQNNVDVFYTNNTGAESDAGAKWISPYIKKTKKLKLTLSWKDGDYTGTSGWHDTDIIVELNDDNSVTIGSLNVPFLSHKKVHQVSGHGWWIQVWLHNYGREIRLKAGAGSGISTRKSLMITKVEEI